jgi:hypothetical protein
VAVAGRRFDAWPPADATPTTIHFHAGGTLSLAEAAPAPDSAFDEYVSDPAVPVPYIDKIAIGMTRPYMTDDQRFASRRPDVLVYETDVLGAGNIHHNDHCTQGLFFYHTRPFAKTGSGQDRRNDAKKGGVLLSQRRTWHLSGRSLSHCASRPPVGAGGKSPKTPRGCAILLWKTTVSQDRLRTNHRKTERKRPFPAGTDSDFVVKLIDVYSGDHPGVGPESGVVMGGYQQLVRGEPMRGKFRNSFEHPEPFVPGEVTTVEFTMPDIFHTFRRGHKLMVHVQSSWFPLVGKTLVLSCPAFAPVSHCSW